MKKIFTSLFILCLSTNLFAQDPQGVEKSIFNVQEGILGIYINNESRLAERFTLRSEIGLEAGFFFESVNYNTFFMAPVINIEPRFYYNINKRARKDKRTANNSANFITTNIKFAPDAFVISNNQNIKVFNQIAFIPKWGIRRSIGSSNFNYELGAGLGYNYVFRKNEGYSKDLKQAVLDLHVRIGYTF